MPHYDVIIIGAGIAGASCAYALKQKGLHILVLEKNTIASGDSHAAGAFLSPKMSKPSPYKSYLNAAFSYSSSFYKEHFPHLFKACGLLKLPLNEADKTRLKSYEPYMQVRWEKRENAYFFSEAGCIEPQALIHAMLQGIEVKEQHEAKSIDYHDSYWHVDGFSATHLLLATGSSTLPFDVPYIKTKKVAGYRYDVNYHDMQTLTYNIHRELSFSYYHDKKIIIGASHMHGEVDIEKAAYHDSEGLLKKAATIQALKELKILKTYTGYRASSLDYFPILGSLIYHDKTLAAFSGIQTGARVPSQRYLLFPNLYIHTALASRGFVFAPYNAAQLTAHILEGTPIDQRLSPARLFTKWARKL